MDKCYKCDKDMTSVGGDSFHGIRVEVDTVENLTPDRVSYYNQQLGKYSNGKGGCSVSICYECYIDGLFQIPLHTAYS